MASNPQGPRKVKTLQIPYRALVIRADPDFESAKRKEPFYQFSNGRRFDEDTSRQGPYSDEPNT
jgi:hypothetical protein